MRSFTGPAKEFEVSRLLYEKNTGRKQPENRDIIAYRMIQSFVPGEITPEDAKKKACYSKYRAARKEMIEYQNAKRNVDRLLGITRLQEKPREKEHGTRIINEK